MSQATSLPRRPQSKTIGACGTQVLIPTHLIASRRPCRDGDSVASCAPSMSSPR
jgi:hypothetical protein